MLAIETPATTELLLMLVPVALVIFPIGVVCKKAGYSPWLAAVCLFPPATVLLVWFLALANWPNATTRAE